MLHVAKSSSEYHSSWLRLDKGNGGLGNLELRILREDVERQRVDDIRFLFLSHLGYHPHTLRSQNKQLVYAREVCLYRGEGHR